MTAKRNPDVLVVGGGSFGTALASVLAGLGKEVRLLVRRADQAHEINERHSNSKYLPGFELPSNLEAGTDLEALIEDAPVVIITVPSRSFREVAVSIGDYVKGDQILLHATKGLEVDPFKRMSEILHEETCALKIGVLSGPNLAAEIMAGHPSGASLASHYEEVLTKVQALFHGGNLRLYGGRDIIGTEIGGAFQSIIALAVGMADGIGFGENTKSLLMTRGLGEMIRFGVRLGAEAVTFYGLSGAGDMIATCTSPLGRDRMVGKALAQGKSLDSILEGARPVAEGVPTTAAVNRQAGELGLNLPIVDAVYRVLYKGRPVKKAVADLMEVPVGGEFAPETNAS